MQRTRTTHVHHLFHRATITASPRTEHQCSPTNTPTGCASVSLSPSLIRLAIQASCTRWSRARDPLPLAVTLHQLYQYDDAIIRWSWRQGRGGGAGITADDDDTGTTLAVSNIGLVKRWLRLMSFECSSLIRERESVEILIVSCSSVRVSQDLGV